MIKNIGIIIVLVFVVFLLGRQMKNQKQNVSTDNKKVSQNENVKNTKNMKAILKTNKGDIEIGLDAEKAPKTVENFINLAKEGFYDGVKFHRVIKDFMIQTGDPLSKDDDMIDRWGTGGPGYQFDDELPQEGEYQLGSVAMANAGPNTNGSQFFIVSGSAGVSLPPLYSLFGQVTKGMDVVEDIQNTETFPDDKPVEPVIIHSVELVEE